MIVYPKADLPSAIQFLPDGGPTGGPAFNLDGAGSDPTILAIRRPPQKLSDWDTSAEFLVDTSSMVVTSNGYEGCGVRTRLLRQGASDPVVLFDNGLLTTQSDEWHTKQATWHKVTQRISYGTSEQPDSEDIQFCLKAPVGSSVKIAQLSVVNQYSRFYDEEVVGESTSIPMLRQEDTTREWLRRPDQTSTPRSMTRTQWASYLSTIPVNIQAGESVRMNFSGVLNAISDSDSDVPVTITAAIKLRTAAGQELWKDVAIETSSVAEIPDTLIEGSIEFLSGADYTQAEMIILMFTQYGRVHATSVGHKGMYFGMTTSRSIISSTNG